MSSAKHLTHWTIHLAQASLVERLETEQEVLMHLADLMIEAYAMESVWLRARKIQASGRDSHAGLIARVYLNGAAGSARSLRDGALCPDRPCLPAAGNS